jgi:hypothetical protein
MQVVIAALAVALLVPGCSDRTSPPPAAESTRSRRVFEKPRGGPRAVPPHAIRSEGVGPYLLSMPLKDVLGLTSRGPSVMLMELEGMVDYSLVRAENDTVIIGVERGGTGVSFVTVVDREIARTDKGVGVGATLGDLEQALGSRRRSATRLSDPRIASFERLPNARFVLDGDVAIAVTVGKRDRPTSNPEGEAAPPEPDQPPPRPRARCGADALREQRDAIVEAARIDAGDDPVQLAFGCLDADDPLVVVTAGDRMVGVTGSPDRLRRLRLDTVDGLVFAGPVDLGGDGKDEIVAVAQSSTPEGKTWRVEVFRGDGGRLGRVASRSVYHLAAASVPWIGATLSEVDLLLAFEAEEETLHVGGLLLQRDGGRVKVVAPLANKRLVVRARGGAGGTDDDEIDGGVRDAARPGGGRPDAGPRRKGKP